MDLQSPLDCPMATGTCINIWRIALGIPRIELAQRTGISSERLRLMLNGEIEPTGVELVKIAKVFGVEEEKLIPPVPRPSRRKRTHKRTRLGA